MQENASGKHSHDGAASTTSSRLSRPNSLSYGAKATHRRSDKKTTKSVEQKDDPKNLPGEELLELGETNMKKASFNERQNSEHST